MFKFLRQKEKEPFSYPTIEMRKSAPKYIKPAVIVVLIAIVLFVVLLSFH